MGPTTSAAANVYPAQRRGRDRLFDRVNLVLLPCLLLLLGARHFGMISPVPAWQIFGSLVLAYVGGVLFATRFPPGTDRREAARSFSR